jgi:rhodanese-related sulfurtransferase
MKLLKTMKALFVPSPRVAIAEAAARVRAQNAVLIDVREPSEWKGGVAEGAMLLPMSDLTGRRSRWK